MGTENDGARAYGKYKERLHKAAQTMREKWANVTELENIRSVHWLLTVHQVMIHGNKYLDTLKASEWVEIRRSMGLSNNDLIAPLEGSALEYGLFQIESRIRQLVSECIHFHALRDWYRAVENADGITTQDVGLDFQLQVVVNSVDLDDPPLWFVELVEEGFWHIYPPTITASVLNKAALIVNTSILIPTR
jgi:hypothetical protein